MRWSMILVDRPLWRWRGQRWAHLVSDTDLGELHRFAARLGLPRSSFQGDHYDLPADFWDRAIALGARPVDSGELVRRLRSSGLRRPKRSRPPRSQARCGSQPDDR